MFSFRSWNLCLFTILLWSFLRPIQAENQHTKGVIQATIDACSRGVRATKKKLQRRYVLGTPYKRIILAGDANEYRKQIWASHPGPDFKRQSPVDPLPGVTRRQMIQLNSLMGQNASDGQVNLIPSYFKAFETPDWKTMWALSILYSWPSPAKKTLESMGAQMSSNMAIEAGAAEPASPVEAPTDKEWNEAVEIVLGWIKTYKAYRSDIDEAIREGFEAKMNAGDECLASEFVRNIRPRSFVGPDGQVVPQTIPQVVLAWNEETDELVGVPIKPKMTNYAHVQALENDIVETIEKTFGLPPNPLQAIRNRMGEFPRVDPRRFFNPSFYVGGLWLYMLRWPVYGINSFYKVPKAFAVWLKSKFDAFGKIQEAQESQPFLMMRLQLAYDVLTDRRDHRHIPLNQKEEELLKVLERALMDPLLFSTSEAVHRMYGKLIAAERWIRFRKRGKKPSAYPLPVLEKYKDGSVRVREGDVTASVMGDLWRWVTKHPAVTGFVSSIVGTAMTIAVYQNIDRIKYRIVESPPVANWVAQNTNARFMDWLEDNRYSMRIDRMADSTGRPWTTENTNFEALAEQYLNQYVQKARLDSDYDPFTDPEFIKDADILLEVYADSWGARPRAAIVAYLQDRWSGYTVPRKTLNLARVILEDEYPSQVDTIAKLTAQFGANNFEERGILDQEFDEKVDPKLIEDLRYFFSKGFSEATDHTQRTGSIFGKGDPYEVFIRARPIEEPEVEVSTP